MGRTPGPSSLKRAERLFRLHGELLFEPWMNRTDDYSMAALLEERGEVHFLGIQRLKVSPAGGFRGIDLFPGLSESSRLQPEEEVQFREVATRVAEKLSGAGYRGLFGIDGFRYRDLGGESRFHPLCEINARMTFGLLVGLIVSRVRGAGSGLCRPPVQFSIGKKDELESLKLSGADLVPLLLPGREDPTAAWLQNK